MDRSIQEVARLAGTTSRTLRHYDAIGLLPSSRVGAGGLRHYDEQALVRLQRILLLRELGLALPQIRLVLDHEQDEVSALRHHLAWLRGEQRRLARQTASVTRTITALERGEQIMAEQMFDGFDHTAYAEEVSRRWGADAYEDSDAWWRGMTKTERQDWQDKAAKLNADWAAAADDGVAPDSARAQDLAGRHVEWLSSVPGTPGHGSGRPDTAYLLGLADLYVADHRFAANYGGQAGAELVRDALRVHAGMS